MHNLKICGWQHGVQGFVYIYFVILALRLHLTYRSPKVLMRVLQILGPEDDKNCYNLRKKYFYDVIRDNILNEEWKVRFKCDDGSEKEIIFEWIYGTVFDLMGGKRDKGTVGPAGWAPQTDVVVYDPATDTFEYISLSDDNLDNALLPMYAPYDLDEDQKNGLF